MSRLLRASAILVALGVASPTVSTAQPLAHWGAGCCQTCLRPCNLCGCASLRPVVETHLQPRTVVTWRNVNRVAYRYEPRYQTVPVVSYRTRLTYRRVPYSVSQRIPQLSTTWIPQRRIRYVPGHYVPQRIGVMPIRQTFPHLAMPGIRAPAAASDLSEWTTNSSRTPQPAVPAQPVALHSPGQNLQPPIPTPAVSNHHEPAGTGPFVRAPSAALVWQTRGVARQR